MGVADGSSGIVAVATDDPLSPSTFSGLSANLFREVERQGVAVHPIATRDMRWHDALRGAVRVSAFTRPASRKESRIDPDWFWSRRTHEAMTRRFRDQLATMPADAPVLQVGTHVQAADGHRRVYCITDLTVAQSLEVGVTYTVGRTSPTVQREALEWQREVFRRCDLVFVLSQWAADSVVTDSGIDPDRVVVVGAGANVPAELPERRRDDEHPTILFVGMDWEQKGGPQLLEAFRAVRERVPTARLTVIGCEPTALQGEPGAQVLGRLDRKDPDQERRLLDAYAGAACFCIVPEVDAFPNVLLEAGAFGLPVVSTDVGSRGEVVVDDVTGRLVPHGDPAALADALTEVLMDPARADRYGAAGAARVRDTMNWPHVVHTMLGLMGVAHDRIAS